MKFTYNILIVSLLFLSACDDTSSQRRRGTTPPTGFRASDMLPNEKLPDGIYHVMAQGETLWQISRRYEIQLSDILRYNQGLDTRDITVGTRVFIPQSHYARKAQVSTSIPPIPQYEFSTEELPKIDSGYPWPVDGNIQREHSWKKPGMTIAAPVGKEIKSIRSGKVILSTSHFPGQWIIIDHGGFWSIYGNLGSRTVEASAEVRQGQVIGTMGKRALHLEFRRNATPFNPRELLGS